MTETTPTPVVPGDLFARHQTITGLRALADFLETNPDVPVHEYGREYSIYTESGSDEAAGWAEVDRIADLLDVNPVDDTDRGGHYWASRQFGRMAYRVVHIPTRAHKAYEARRSYEANIRVSDERTDGQAA